MANLIQHFPFEFEKNVRHRVFDHNTRPPSELVEKLREHCDEPALDVVYLDEKQGQHVGEWHICLLKRDGQNRLRLVSQGSLKTAEGDPLIDADICVGRKQAEAIERARVAMQDDHMERLEEKARREGREAREARRNSSREAAESLTNKSYRDAWDLKDGRSRDDRILRDKFREIRKMRREAKDEQMAETIRKTTQALTAQ